MNIDLCNDTRVANIMTNDHNTSLCNQTYYHTRLPVDLLMPHLNIEWQRRKERMTRSMSHPLKDHQECYCPHIRNLVYHNELSLRKVTLKWDTRFPNTFYGVCSKFEISQTLSAFVFVVLEEGSICGSNTYCKDFM